MSASVPDEERVQPRGTRNEKRWAEVLDAAEQVFLERGYQAASLKEIATRVGMLKGSLYYYIDTKEDLLFEIVRRAHQSGLEFIAREERRGGARRARTHPQPGPPLGPRRYCAEPASESRRG